MTKKKKKNVPPSNQPTNQPVTLALFPPGDSTVRDTVLISKTEPQLFNFQSPGGAIDVLYYLDHQKASSFRKPARVKEHSCLLAYSK